MSDFLQDSLAGLLIAGIFLALGALGLPIPYVGTFFALLTGVYHVYLLGKRLMPGLGLVVKLCLGGVLFCAILAIVQTAYFYANIPLNAASDIWTLFFTCITVQLITLRPLTKQDAASSAQETWLPMRMMLAALLLIVGGVCTFYVLHAALGAATTASIRTPWPLLPAGTLPAIGFVWLSAILSARLVRSRVCTMLHAVMGLGTVTLIAPLLYRLGYGFDGFLHLTGERILSTTGTLSPQPPYYIGQYVFTTWLARIVDVPGALAAIDRYLVPVCAALMLPLALFTSRPQKAHIAPLACIVLPLAAFVSTTPQSFAYVLGLSAMLLAYGMSARVALPIALWSVAVHPLAGIPFFLMTLALCSVCRQKDELRAWRQFGAGICALLAGIAIPLAFIFVGTRAGTHIDWDISRLWTWTPWLDALQGVQPWIGTTYSLWPGWASLIQQALPALLLLIVIVHAVRSRLTGKAREPGTWALVCAAVCLFLAAAVLKTTGDFAFLIDYERGNYADRLLLIATLALWAAAIPAVGDLFEELVNLPPIQHALAVWMMCAAGVGLAYDALPRHDALIVGHGWSVGKTDIEAVRAIDRDAGDKPYTVLADQSVSAAAVSEIGFKRYAGDVFYYPIPTGGPLYAIYLDIAAGNRIHDNVLDAAGLGQSKIVYAVINDYWWQADRVNEALAAAADAAWSFGDPTLGPGHAVTVYTFDVTKSVKRDAAKAGK